VVSLLQLKATGGRSEESLLVKRYCLKVGAEARVWGDRWRVVDCRYLI
jgi:hypothetical protein